MNYHNITKCDMINGEGIRVVLWVSGCNHHCHNCHNPQTHDPNSGIEFTEDTITELYDELNNDWCSGITFSGGDPLYPDNRPTIAALGKSIKKDFPDKSIWLWTGYSFEALLELRKRDINILEILKVCDVIVDGVFIEELKSTSLQYCGSSNQRIIDVQASLKSGEAIIYKI